MFLSHNEKKIFSKTVAALLIVAIATGVLSALLALSIKHATEFVEEHSYATASKNPIAFVIFPVLGLLSIGLIRIIFFKNKPNKGISEVFESLGPGKKLPANKIASHFVNGFATVVSGGSTGVEVSTVVATAAIGSEMHKFQTFFKKYRRELVCAGIAAGITSLFNSPLAGIFFCVEVIARKRSRLFYVATASSTGAALLVGFLLSEPRLLETGADHWNLKALPFFLVVALLTGLLSVYLTRCVLFFKTVKSRIPNEFLRILLGAVVLGGLLIALPGLFGDSYHSTKELLLYKSYSVAIGFGIMLLILAKPIAVSLTLASGGDGGVFAPSLVIGAWTGLLVSMVVNQYSGIGLIPLNFMLVGMAAALSASIHAPLTAVFLVCGISGNYVLMLPLLVASYLSKRVSFRLLPYNVYTYKST